ncbi:MAG: hypothetical protein K6T37_07815 [Acidothermus cellulolyticus]|nr:hypothetical protein [Acidothermus cellulolyticus]
MSAVQKVKGHPTPGGLDDRLLAPSIIPQIRRVVHVEVTTMATWDDRAELMVIEWPRSLTLPAVVIVDLRDAERVEGFTQSHGVEFCARDLLNRACASLLGCRPGDVDPGDLGPAELRDAWALLQQSVLQFEGTRPRAVEATASAFERALLDLADELGVGG